MAERLYILDAHSLIYQVFHAIPEMTAPNGMPTNAVFGFVRDIQFLRRDRKPEYLVCAFDQSEQTFRHEIDPNYKANRGSMPDDLRPQIGMIHRILEAFRIPVVSQAGIEADDFLATVGKQATERKINAYLCTADKDVRQCLTKFAVMYDLRKNRVINEEFLANDWEIRPDQVVDYQALIGDSTDNVPGVAGIGPKTARDLLNKYESLDAIYEHIDEIPKKGVRDKLYKGKKSAYLSQQLVRLKDDVEIPSDWSEWRLQEPDVDALLELFDECGFHRFRDEMTEESAPAADWDVDYDLVSNQRQLANLIKELEKQTSISVDLETTSVNPAEAEIVGIALSWQVGTAFYVAVRGPEGQTELETDSVLSQLKPVLENAEIEKVGQNLKYDMVVFRCAGVELAGVGFDTMVASYLLEPGERNHNLDSLSQRLLQHQTIKITELIGEAKRGQAQLSMDQVDLDKVAEYAGEDVDVALRLTEILRPQIEKEGLADLMRTLECPLIDVLAEMEFNGIRIDASLLKQQSDDFAEKIELLKAQAYELGGREFNLDSPKQLRELLFNELNLPVIKRTKTGPSTDQEVLEQLAADHDICATIIAYRQLTKLKSTYLDALPTMVNPKTGRIHASFNQTVAATGRLSSSDPNLQNIPIRTDEGRQIRAAFIPGSVDQVLLAADYSQIELRLLAYYSGDPNLTQAFVDDRDIHVVVGAQIEGVELEEVTSETRRRAKAVNFGIMYGLSPFGLARQLKISQDEAAEFIESYFEQYPGIDDFITKTLQLAKKERCVRTVLGRHRPISGIKNVTGRVRNLPERTAINTVIQGSAADLIKKAMLAIHHRLRTEDFAARMLLQIHDELVFEVDKEQVKDVAQMINHEMITALDIDPVPLKVDTGVGPNWLDLQPLEA